MPTIQAQYEGRSARIKCLGNVVLTWTFNDTQLPADVTVKDDEIEIRNVQMHHTGKYSCKMIITAEGETRPKTMFSFLFVGG